MIAGGYPTILLWIPLQQLLARYGMLEYQVWAERVASL